jgi:hypothetical protein
MPLNSTYLGHMTSLILYLGAVVMPRCTSIARKPADGDQSFSPKGLHLISISVHLLDLCVAQGEYSSPPLSSLLMSWSSCYCPQQVRPGCWAPRDHHLDHKRLLLLRYVLWCIRLWLLWLWHVPRCQLTNGWTTNALACGAASTSHLSFRKGRV